MFTLQELNAPKASTQLVSLSSSSSFSVRSYFGYVVRRFKFLAHSCDSNRNTQNNGICVRRLDNQTYYGVLEEIHELSYINNNSVIIFKCKLFDTNPTKRRVQYHKNRMNIFVKDRGMRMNHLYLHLKQNKFFRWMICSTIHTGELLNTLDIDIYGIFQKQMWTM